MPRPATVTRASKATREKIIKAASDAFARNGYEGASIRTIVAEADVNQAAISYHFGSKEGLYRAVLQAALLALMKDDDSRRSPDKLSREAALRRFVRQQLRPMTSGDDLSAYVRIFSWEALRPSPVFRKFMAREAAPFFAAATQLVRRFRPAGRATPRRRSARSGCSDNAAFSCAMPSSSRLRRSASLSTSVSWTG